jgi:hypothetical protein
MVERGASDRTLLTSVALVMELSLHSCGRQRQAGPRWRREQLRHASDGPSQNFERRRLTISVVLRSQRRIRAQSVPGKPDT